MKRPASRLYLLFSPELCRADAWDTLHAALSGGVDLVQWRGPSSAPHDDLQRTMQICRAARVPLIVNDSPALAAQLDAAGTHVGQDDMPAAQARAVLGPERWLGVSTHDTAQIRAAEAAGADYVGFGPCFPTATKGYGQGLALEDVAAAHAATDLPVFAIGGISELNLPTLMAVGVRRIAVCAAILGAGDPEAVARSLAGLLPQ